MAPVLRLILTYTKVHRNTKLKAAGVEFTVDGATQFGLVRFLSNVDGSNSGHLMCAYAFLWLFSSVTNDALLSCWDYNYLQSRQNKNDPSRVPPGVQFWQPFEDFLGRFRVMKSLINEDGAIINIDSLHSGALLNGDFQFTNHHLKFEKASSRVSTKAGRKTLKVPYEQGVVNASECGYYIVNAPGAAAGDGFCGLKKEDGAVIHEVHQAKLLQNDFNEESFNIEREKAVTKEDYFILFTTSTYTGNIPNFSAVVDTTVWYEYFGPFAGRAFLWTQKKPLANLAPFSVLTSVDYISEKRARCIQVERDKRKFTDIDDCSRRTKIPQKFLKNLSFSF
ncbi:hypothetical protein HK096_011144 [Nowakowskiella sp. JEL0078]|nr:hypothetical protein HK096_011144 [Nowakowskiella sp. JEL0078]